MFDDSISAPAQVSKKVLTHKSAANIKAPIIVGVRDHRLDMFRGLALVMIFINHVPGSALEQITSRNFGFSDAAEAFVFMSGMAAGLAYSSRFVPGQMWPAMVKVWSRARQLYFVHIVSMMLAIAVFALAAMWFDVPQLLATNNIAPLLDMPLATLVGIPIMTHQLGYFNILPLYILMLAVTPILLVIGLKRPMRLLAISIVVWAMAGQFGINMPNFPNEGGWFFNPFSWQLVFVIGLLTGTAMRQGRPFVAYNQTLFTISAAFVVLVLLWVKVPLIEGAGLSVLRTFADAGLPSYITWFDKTFLPLPRLLHVLALIYVVSYLGSVRTVSESRFASPLTLLGRNGLAVFAFGSILSFVLQAAKPIIGSGPILDASLIIFGLALQLGLASLLTWARTMTQRTAKA